MYSSKMLRNERIFGCFWSSTRASCDMRLISLQGLNREKLEAEYKDLEEKITYYNQLLTSKDMVADAVQLLILYLLSDVFDHLPFIDLIGQFGDNNTGAVLTKFPAQPFPQPAG